MSKEDKLAEEIDNLLCRCAQAYDNASHKTLLVRAHREEIINLVKEALDKFEPVQLEVLSGEDLGLLPRYAVTTSGQEVSAGDWRLRAQDIMYALNTHNEAKGQLYRRVE